MASTSPSPRPSARQARGTLAGQVAKALGIGVQTLHYYEREALIPPPERTDAGYRLYTPDLVERVRFIRKAQALGLPLSEIKEVLEIAAQGACPCGHVQAVFEQKLAEVDRRLRELRDFRRELVTLVERGARASTRNGTARICAIVEESSVSPAMLPAAAPIALRRGRKRA